MSDTAIEVQTRGALTKPVQAKAKELLGHELTVRELRLLPYLDYQAKNEQRLKRAQLNDEENDILRKWYAAGYIDGGYDRLKLSKKFYDAIQQILWLAYVEIKR
jgi:hypothetical protein